MKPNPPINWPLLHAYGFYGVNGFHEHAITFEDIGTRYHRDWLFDTGQLDKLLVQYPDTTIAKLVKGAMRSRELPATADGAHAGNVLQGQTDNGQPTLSRLTIQQSITSPF